MKKNLYICNIIKWQDSIKIVRNYKSVSGLMKSLMSLNICTVFKY